MIFTTYWFSVFACAFFPLFWAARIGWLRLGLLLAACFTFHAHFAGAAGMLPIIVLATTTYAAGLLRWRPVLYAAAKGVPMKRECANRPSPGGRASSRPERRATL